MWGNFIQLPVQPTEESQLLDSIAYAQREWKCAEGRFNEATDADLVDQAIYDLMAAKTKYSYLVRKAKERDLHV